MTQRHAFSDEVVRQVVPHEPLRAAQQAWAQLPLAHRLLLLRPLRSQLAENGDNLAHLAAEVNNRPRAEKLVSEVLPLAEAAHWLQLRAPRILAAREHGRWRNPFWLRGHTFEIERRPFGLVLVVGPRNMPLFLPAVQTLHALVAGNAVLLKPAPGTRAVALAFAELLQAIGLGSHLLTVLSDDAVAVHEALRGGVDKLCFTGSSASGGLVQAALARSATPAIMELSGEDALVVLRDADLSLAARALHFGRELNGGQTCLAPHRLILENEIADSFLGQLSWADAQGLDVQRVSGDEEIVRAINASRFGLGAAIFAHDLVRARALARRFEVGCVTINDLIMPTADPRLPFGGVKASGFGTTRGAEGLLEMTYPHVVSLRDGRRRPHFAPLRPGDAKLFDAYLRARHGRRRLRAWFELLRAAYRRGKLPNE